MGHARSVVAALNATLNAHDVPGGRLLYATDARLVTAQGRRLDLDGIDAMVGLTLRAFPDLEFTVLRWVEDGDVIVTEEVMEGTHQGEFAGIAPTGRPVRLPMVHVTRVVDGRIVERVAYHDTAGILRQLSGD
jgi:predicted ester cyclase